MSEGQTQSSQHLKAWQSNCEKGMGIEFWKQHEKTIDHMQETLKTDTVVSAEIMEGQAPVL
jgi:hypothetical protein